MRRLSNSMGGGAADGDNSALWTEWESEQQQQQQQQQPVGGGGADTMRAGAGGDLTSEWMPPPTQETSHPISGVGPAGGEELDDLDASLPISAWQSLATQVRIHGLRADER